MVEYWWTHTSFQVHDAHSWAVHVKNLSLGVPTDGITGPFPQPKGLGVSFSEQSFFRSKEKPETRTNFLGGRSREESPGRAVLLDFPFNQAVGLVVKMWRLCLWGATSSEVYVFINSAVFVRATMMP